MSFKERYVKQKMRFLQVEKKKLKMVVQDMQAKETKLRQELLFTLEWLDKRNMEYKEIGNIMENLSEEEEDVGNLSDDSFLHPTEEVGGSESGDTDEEHYPARSMNETPGSLTPAATLLMLHGNPDQPPMGQFSGSRNTNPLLVPPPLKLKSSSTPKRQSLTQHDGKAIRVKPIPVDSSGKFILPSVLGKSSSRVSVYNLGEIVTDRPNFHNTHFIYPINFMCKRKFASYSDPSQRIFYTCRILDGVTGPKFQIVPQEDTHKAIESSKMTELWRLFQCLLAGSAARELNEFASPEDFFGLEHPSIHKAIQELPGVEKLSGYQHITYTIIPPRERHDHDE